jgi:hypothetical protein
MQRVCATGLGRNGAAVHETGRCYEMEINVEILR